MLLYVSLISMVLIIIVYSSQAVFSDKPCFASLWHDAGAGRSHTPCRSNSKVIVAHIIANIT